ncbi:MAG: PQQ-binding-like beta-propeller repeat protein [Candidatus Bathyarchaeia archaeon]
MKTKRNGTSTTAIVFVTMLSVAALMSSMTFAKAVTNVTTYAYLSLNPNPISLGEYTVVNMWLQPIPPTASDIFHGFMVSITRPDGTTESRGPFSSSAIGSQYFEYTPTTLGTYTFKMTYPGETFANGTFVYSPSETPTSSLVVQEQPVQSWPETPVPNDFWTRPINAANRLWNSISGNWLIRGYNTTYVQGASDSGKGYNPYSNAPRSPHVVWTKELALGGMIGGEFEDASFYNGLTYEAKLTPPIVMDGKLYYRMYPSDFGYYQGVAGAWPGAICVDLRTGTELWRNPDMNLDAGQIYNFVSGNQMGGIPYLWDMSSFGPFALFAVGPSIMARPNTWHLYDANTGALIANFTNAAASAFAAPAVAVYGSDGAMYVYVLNGRAGWLAMWNSTKALAAAGFIPGITGSEVPFLRNKPGTYNWLSGIQWNKTIPIITVMDATGPLFPGAGGVTGNVLVAAVESRATSYKEIGYSIIDGTQLWVHDLDIDHYTAARAYGQGVYAGFNPNRRVWIGYDVNTGTQLWTSDPTDYPWGTYGLSGLITYGKLYVLSYDGSVHAFDIANGKEVFKYYSGDDLYRETPYGTFPFYYGPIIADGVVFAGNGEHSPSIPLYRGYQLHAFSATDGTKVWTFPGWHVIQALADGYLVSYNAEDNEIYVFGKGPSATTVSVSSEVVPLGSSVLIKGTVTDQSAGQPGSPAIADKDMSNWMNYLKRQQPIPGDAVGVPVTLSAVGPDGSVISIGTVTSDMSGMYKQLWQPPVQGVYTIMATFAGSDSYGSSFAEAALGVTAGAAPSPTTPPANAGGQGIGTEMYVLIAAIVVVIIVVLAAVFLRRRKQ